MSEHLYKEDVMLGLKQVEEQQLIQLKQCWEGVRNSRLRIRVVEAVINHISEWGMKIRPDWLLWINHLDSLIVTVRLNTSTRVTEVGCKPDTTSERTMIIYFVLIFMFAVLSLWLLNHMIIYWSDSHNTKSVKRCCFVNGAPMKYQFW